ncbi:hypothetical protein NLJ89_g11384 [Agrocybe chaxingu]|uniref:Uncharacterized protein n=1 Tax=Agrocybe chaxingu TaxID=84603 RepID=A0A9W8JQ20_9AGAR|nr:hypothetical protein NLJ89_g11384 [Agrocybe chaxingu]
MSTSQDIVINNRLDLKGALAFLRAPHCVSATSITLSNLDWDVLSVGHTQVPVPEHCAPCPRPLEVPEEGPHTTQETHAARPGWQRPVHAPPLHPATAPTRLSRYYADGPRSEEVVDR